MKSRKRFIIVWTALILVTVAFAIIFKMDTKMPNFDYESIANNNISYDIHDTVVEMYRERNLYSVKADTDFQELEKESDTIVRVSGAKNRAMKFENLLTELEVKEVYKGDVNSDKIWVYEPLNITVYPESNYIYLQWCYNLMEEDEDYILFLKFREMPEGYNYSDKDKATFLLSHVAYSKITVNDPIFPQALKGNSAPSERDKYKDMKQYTLITMDPLVKAKYNEIRDMSLKKYLG